MNPNHFYLYFYSNVFSDDFLNAWNEAYDVASVMEEDLDNFLTYCML